MSARVRPGKTDREKYASALWRQGAPRRDAAQQRLLATGTPVKERITMALDACGLYGPEVDVACGGVEPMVDEWEAGTRVPTPEQIVLLTDLTGYAVKFFYEPLAVEIGPMFMCGPVRCRVFDPVSATAAPSPTPDAAEQGAGVAGGTGVAGKSALLSPPEERAQHAPPAGDPHINPQ